MYEFIATEYFDIPTSQVLLFSIFVDCIGIPIDKRF